MNIVRQRKLDARAHRQEVLHPTAEKTYIKTPQPNNFPVNETVKLGKSLNKQLKKELPLAKKVSFKTPVVTETVKRGPGRPPKAASEKISVKKKTIAGNKKLASVKGKK